MGFRAEFYLRLLPLRLKLSAAMCVICDDRHSNDGQFELMPKHCTSAQVDSGQRE